MRSRSRRALLLYRVYLRYRGKGLTKFEWHEKFWVNSIEGDRWFNDFKKLMIVAGNYSPRWARKHQSLITKSEKDPDVGPMRTYMLNKRRQL